MGKKEFTYKAYNGKELLKDNINVLAKMQDVINTQNVDHIDGSSILAFLDESSHVICMMLEEDIIGFSWITLAEEVGEAELSWFYSDKNKMKGLDAKQLFDKSIEYCQSKDITTLRFNCSDSWSRIKDIDRLLEGFGYKTLDDKQNFDVSIDILEK